MARRVLDDLIERIFAKDLQNFQLVQRVREEHEELVTGSLMTISSHYEKLFEQLRKEQNMIIVDIQSNLEKKLDELSKIDEKIEEYRFWLLSSNQITSFSMSYRLLQ